MSYITWINRPHRTRPAYVTLKPWDTDGIVKPDGTVIHAKRADIGEDPVIDTGQTRFGAKIAQVPREACGSRGLIGWIYADEAPDGHIRATLTVQGGRKGGRRHFVYHGIDALSEAEAHLVRWACRRFRVDAAR